MADITYCGHYECTSKECMRHYCHAPASRVVSWAMFKCPYMPLDSFDGYEPVVHAHWVDRPDGAYRICTNCNCGVPAMPQPPAWFRCPVCGAHMDEKRMVPMYLGNCEETDCEHWRWCGDSYHDRNTECYCLLNGKRVYRHEAEEEMILCPMGKMMEDEE